MSNYEMVLLLQLFNTVLLIAMLRQKPIFVFGQPKKWKR